MKKQIIKIKKDTNGITLIALIITIIVLLILAGISIASLTGKNSILNKSTLATEEYEKATIKEELELEIANILSEKMQKGENFKREDLLELENMGVFIEDIGIPALGEYKNYLIEIDENNKVTVIDKLKEETAGLVRKITLNKKSKVLKPDETFKLEATIYPDDAINKNLTWSSDNEDVAIVSQDGTVTAKTNGIAHIKAKAQDERGISATCEIKVDSSLSDFSVLNYPIDVDGDGDYTNDWNVLYDGEEGLFLISNKCINFSKYNKEKFTSHGYCAFNLNENYPKYINPWEGAVAPTVTNSDYLPSLERLSEFPGNELLLQEWSKLSDEDKKKWPSGVLWAFNSCGPGMLDYNMWTDFIASDFGELCIGSPTIELLQLSSEWSGLGRVYCPLEFNNIWGYGGPVNDNISFGSILGTPLGTSPEPFIMPYGFNGSNSGVIFSGIKNSMIYFGTWVFRWYEMGGIRPCVKVKSGITFNPNSLMLE